jgi:hypothetical protein
MTQAFTKPLAVTVNKGIYGNIPELLRTAFGISRSRCACAIGAIRYLEAIVIFSQNFGNGMYATEVIQVLKPECYLLNNTDIDYSYGHMC